MPFGRRKNEREGDEGKKENFDLKNAKGRKIKACA
jgi:hypothetical protein